MPFNWSAHEASSIAISVAQGRCVPSRRHRGVRPPCLALGTGALCSALTPIYDGLTQSTETTAFYARTRIRTHTCIRMHTRLAHAPPGNQVQYLERKGKIPKLMFGAMLLQLHRSTGGLRSFATWPKPRRMLATWLTPRRTFAISPYGRNYFRPHCSAMGKG